MTKHDEIVDGEALSAVEGVDATYLIGSAKVIDMQRDPQRAAFVRYRLAFRRNEQKPNLSSAVDLVTAYQDLRTVLGLDQE